MPDDVVIDDGPMSIAELVAVADGAGLVLGETAKARIAASRAVVEEVLRSDRLVYGLTSRLGHLKDKRVPAGDVVEYQLDMLAAHAGGIGWRLPTRVVRAAVAARVNGLARGGAGASPAVAETFVALLNAGVHPDVPVRGSVGASDLNQMAAIGLVATGRGTATVDGSTVPGGEALQRAGIAPLAPQPKDGLAILNANGLSIGHAALVVDYAARVARAADVVFALSLEAIGGNTSVIEPHVAAAKPVPGQADAAAHMRELLRGSYLWDHGAARSIQDPLSFRTAPQVHGAFREVTRTATDAVHIELNARDDNPLVAEGTITSNGNFSPVYMALTLDTLRPAAVHVARISERRLQHLAPGVWDDQFADPSLPGTILYSAAEAVAELRSLAGPVTLDCPPVDYGIEEHTTTAPFAVRRTEEALDRLCDVLAIEAIVAIEHLYRAERRPQLGAGTTAALEIFALAYGPQYSEVPFLEKHGGVRAALLDVG